jgi:hypothetical protein
MEIIDGAKFESIIKSRGRNMSTDEILIEHIPEVLRQYIIRITDHGYILTEHTDSEKSLLLMRIIHVETNRKFDGEYHFGGTVRISIAMMNEANNPLMYVRSMEEILKESFIYLLEKMVKEIMDENGEMVLPSEEDVRH